MWLTCELSDILISELSHIANTQYENAVDGTFITILFIIALTAVLVRPEKPARATSTATTKGTVHYTQDSMWKTVLVLVV